MTFPHAVENARRGGPLSPTRRSRAALALALSCSALVAGAFATPAMAGKLDTGFIAGESGDVLSANDASTRALWLQRARAAGSRLIRITVPWRSVAPGSRPANPSDPNVYNLSHLAATITSVRQAGLEPILMPYSAPNWAQSGKQPGWVGQDGAWKPRPADFAAFGRALATRFNGVNGPRVRYYQAWVEPNLTIYIAPQWKNGKKIVSADHYRKMLNGFYGAVRRVNRGNKVITAGTAPFGDDVGEGKRKKTGGRTRPLAFWRELFCLKKNLKKQSGKCRKAKFDILAHHPINVHHKPSWRPSSNDDLVPSNLKGLTKALRKAEKRKTLGTRGKHPLWVDEIWLETSPPDKKNGVPERKHAAYLAETMYLIAKAGGSTVLNLQIQDAPVDNSQPFYFSVQSGMWYAPNFRGGKQKKYAFRAFRFPVWADRKNRKKVKVWGRAPRGGKVQIQVKKGKGGFKNAGSKKVGKFKTFQKTIRLKGQGKVRARFSNEVALAIKVGKR